jgi:hypothetical protein
MLCFNALQVNVGLVIPSMDSGYNDLQGMEMIALGNNVSNYMDTKSFNSEMRPLVSVFKDPRSWWRYAIHSVLLQVRRTNRSCTYQALSKHATDKLVYMELWMNELRHPTSSKDRKRARSKAVELNDRAGSAYEAANIAAIGELVDRESREYQKLLGIARLRRKPIRSEASEISTPIKFHEAHELETTSEDSSKQPTGNYEDPQQTATDTVHQNGNSPDSPSSPTESNKENDLVPEFIKLSETDHLLLANLETELAVEQIIYYRALAEMAIVQYNVDFPSTSSNYKTSSWSAGLISWLYPGDDDDKSVSKDGNQRQQEGKIANIRADLKTRMQAVSTSSVPSKKSSTKKQKQGGEISQWDIDVGLSMVIASSTLELIFSDESPSFKQGTTNSLIPPQPFMRLETRSIEIDVKVVKLGSVDGRVNVDVGLKWHDSDICEPSSLLQYKNRHHYTHGPISYSKFMYRRPNCQGSEPVDSDAPETMPSALVEEKSLAGSKKYEADVRTKGAGSLFAPSVSIAAPSSTNQSEIFTDPAFELRFALTRKPAQTNRARSNSRTEGIGGTEADIGEQEPQETVIRNVKISMAPYNVLIGGDSPFISLIDSFCDRAGWYGEPFELRKYRKEVIEDKDTIKDAAVKPRQHELKDPRELMRGNLEMMMNNRSDVFVEINLATSFYFIAAKRSVFDNFSGDMLVMRGGDIKFTTLKRVEKPVDDYHLALTKPPTYVHIDDSNSFRSSSTQLSSGVQLVSNKTGQKKKPVVIVDVLNAELSNMRCHLCCYRQGVCTEAVVLLEAPNSMNMKMFVLTDRTVSNNTIPWARLECIQTGLHVDVTESKLNSLIAFINRAWIVNTAARNAPINKSASTTGEQNDLIELLDDTSNEDYFEIGTEDGGDDGIAVFTGDVVFEDDQFFYDPVSSPGSTGNKEPTPSSAGRVVDEDGDIFFDAAETDAPGSGSDIAEFEKSLYAGMSLSELNNEIRKAEAERVALEEIISGPKTPVEDVDSEEEPSKEGSAENLQLSTCYNRIHYLRELYGELILNQMQFTKTTGIRSEAENSLGSADRKRQQHDAVQAFVDAMERANHSSMQQLESLTPHNRVKQLFYRRRIGRNSSGSSLTPSHGAKAFEKENILFVQLCVKFVGFTCSMAFEPTSSDSSSAVSASDSLSMLSFSMSDLQCQAAVFSLSSLVNASLDDIHLNYTLGRTPSAPTYASVSASNIRKYDIIRLGSNRNTSTAIQRLFTCSYLVKYKVAQSIVPSSPCPLTKPNSDAAPPHNDQTGLLMWVKEHYIDVKLGEVETIVDFKFVSELIQVASTMADRFAMLTNTKAPGSSRESSQAASVPDSVSKDNNANSDDAKKTAKKKKSKSSRSASSPFKVALTLSSGGVRVSVPHVDNRDWTIISLHTGTHTSIKLDLNSFEYRHALQRAVNTSHYYGSLYDNSAPCGSSDDVKYLLKTVASFSVQTSGAQILSKAGASPSLEVVQWVTYGTSSGATTSNGGNISITGCIERNREIPLLDANTSELAKIDDFVNRFQCTTSVCNDCLVLLDMSPVVALGENIIASGLADSVQAFQRRRNESNTYQDASATRKAPANKPKTVSSPSQSSPRQTSSVLSKISNWCATFKFSTSLLQLRTARSFCTSADDIRQLPAITAGLESVELMCVFGDHESELARQNRCVVVMEVMNRINNVSVLLDHNLPIIEPFSVCSQTVMCLDTLSSEGAQGIQSSREFSDRQDSYNKYSRSHPTFILQEAYELKSLIARSLFRPKEIESISTSEVFISSAASPVSVNVSTQLVETFGEAVQLVQSGLSTSTKEIFRSLQSRLTPPSSSSPKVDDNKSSSASSGQGQSGSSKPLKGHPAKPPMAPVIAPQPPSPQYQQLHHRQLTPPRSSLSRSSSLSQAGTSSEYGQYASFDSSDFGNMERERGMKGQPSSVSTAVHRRFIKVGVSFVLYEAVLQLRESRPSSFVKYSLVTRGFHSLVFARIPMGKAPGGANSTQRNGSASSPQRATADNLGRSNSYGSNAKTSLMSHRDGSLLFEEKEENMFLVDTFTMLSSFDITCHQDRSGSNVRRLVFTDHGKPLPNAASAPFYCSSVPIPALTDNLLMNSESRSTLRYKQMKDNPTLLLLNVSVTPTMDVSIGTRLSNAHTLVDGQLLVGLIQYGESYVPVVKSMVGLVTESGSTASENSLMGSTLLDPTDPASPTNPEVKADTEFDLMSNPFVIEQPQEVNSQSSEINLPATSLLLTKSSVRLPSKLGKLRLAVQLVDIVCWIPCSANKPEQFGACAVDVASSACHPHIVSTISNSIALEVKSVDVDTLLSNCISASASRYADFLTAAIEVDPIKLQQIDGICSTASASMAPIESLLQTLRTAASPRSPSVSTPRQNDFTSNLMVTHTTSSSVTSTPRIVDLFFQPMHGKILCVCSIVRQSMLDRIQDASEPRTPVTPATLNTSCSTFSIASGSGHDINKPAFVVDIESARFNILKSVDVKMQPVSLNLQFNMQLLLDCYEHNFKQVVAEVQTLMADYGPKKKVGGGLKSKNRTNSSQEGASVPAATGSPMTISAGAENGTGSAGENAPWTLASVHKLDSVKSLFQFIPVSLTSGISLVTVTLDSVTINCVDNFAGNTPLNLLRVCMHQFRLSLKYGGSYRSAAVLASVPVHDLTTSSFTSSDRYGPGQLADAVIECDIPKHSGSSKLLVEMTSVNEIEYYCSDTLSWCKLVDQTKATVSVRLPWESEPAAGPILWRLGADAVEDVNIHALPRLVSDAQTQQRSPAPPTGLFASQFRTRRVHTKTVLFGGFTSQPQSSGAKSDTAAAMDGAVIGPTVDVAVSSPIVFNISQGLVDSMFVIGSKLKLTASLVTKTFSTLQDSRDALGSLSATSDSPPSPYSSSSNFVLRNETGVPIDYWIQTPAFARTVAENTEELVDLTIPVMLSGGHPHSSRRSICAFDPVYSVSRKITLRVAGHEFADISLIGTGRRLISLASNSGGATANRDVGVVMYLTSKLGVKTLLVRSTVSIRNNLKVPISIALQQPARNSTTKYSFTADSSNKVSVWESPLVAPGHKIGVPFGLLSSNKSAWNSQSSTLDHQVSLKVRFANTVVDASIHRGQQELHHVCEVQIPEFPVSNSRSSRARNNNKRLDGANDDSVEDVASNEDFDKEKTKADFKYRHCIKRKPSSERDPMSLSYSNWIQATVEKLSVNAQGTQPNTNLIAASTPASSSTALSTFVSKENRQNGSDNNNIIVDVVSTSDLSFASPSTQESVGRLDIKSLASSLLKSPEDDPLSANQNCLHRRLTVQPPVVVYNMLACDMEIELSSVAYTGWLQYLPLLGLGNDDREDQTSVMYNLLAGKSIQCLHFHALDDFVVKLRCLHAVGMSSACTIKACSSRSQKLSSPSSGASSTHIVELSLPNSSTMCVCVNVLEAAGCRSLYLYAHYWLVYPRHLAFEMRHDMFGYRPVSPFGSDLNGDDNMIFTHSNIGQGSNLAVSNALAAYAASMSLSKHSGQPSATMPQSIASEEYAVVHLCHSNFESHTSKIAVRLPGYDWSSTLSLQSPGKSLQLGGANASDQVSLLSVSSTQLSGNKHTNVVFVQERFVFINRTTEAIQIQQYREPSSSSPSVNNAADVLTLAKDAAGCLQWKEVSSKKELFVQVNVTRQGWNWSGKIAIATSNGGDNVIVKLTNQHLQTHYFLNACMQTSSVSNRTTIEFTCIPSTQASLVASKKVLNNGFIPYLIENYTQSSIRYGQVGQPAATAACVLAANSWTPYYWDESHSKAAKSIQLHYQSHNAASGVGSWISFGSFSFDKCSLSNEDTARAGKNEQTKQEPSPQDNLKCLLCDTIDPVSHEVYRVYSVSRGPYFSIVVIDSSTFVDSAGTVRQGPDERRITRNTDLARVLGYEGDGIVSSQPSLQPPKPCVYKLKASVSIPGIRTVIIGRDEILVMSMTGLQTDVALVDRVRSDPNVVSCFGDEQGVRLKVASIVGALSVELKTSYRVASADGFAEAQSRLNNSRMDDMFTTFIMYNVTDSKSNVGIAGSSADLKRPYVNMFVDISLRGANNSVVVFNEVRASLSTLRLCLDGNVLLPLGKLFVPFVRSLKHVQQEIAGGGSPSSQPSTEDCLLLLSKLKQQYTKRCSGGGSKPITAVSPVVYFRSLSLSPIGIILNVDPALAEIIPDISRVAFLNSFLSLFTSSLSGLMKLDDCALTLGALEGDHLFVRDLVARLRQSLMKELPTNIKSVFKSIQAYERPVLAADMLGTAVVDVCLEPLKARNPVEFVKKTVFGVSSLVRNSSASAVVSSSAVMATIGSMMLAWATALEKQKQGKAAPQKLARQSNGSSATPVAVARQVQAPPTRPTSTGVVIGHVSTPSKRNAVTPTPSSAAANDSRAGAGAGVGAGVGVSGVAWGVSSLGAALSATSTRLDHFASAISTLPSAEKSDEAKSDLGAISAPTPTRVSIAFANALLSDSMIDDEGMDNQSATTHGTGSVNYRHVHNVTQEFGPDLLQRALNSANLPHEHYIYHCVLHGSAEISSGQSSSTNNVTLILTSHSVLLVVDLFGSCEIIWRCRLKHLLSLSVQYNQNKDMFEFTDFTLTEDTPLVVPVDTPDAGSDKPITSSVSAPAALNNSSKNRSSSSATSSLSNTTSPIRFPAVNSSSAAAEYDNNSSSYYVYNYFFSDNTGGSANASQLERSPPPTLKQPMAAVFPHLGDNYSPMVSSRSAGTTSTTSTTTSSVSTARSQPGNGLRHSASTRSVGSPVSLRKLVQSNAQSVSSLSPALASSSSVGGTNAANSSNRGQDDFLSVHTRLKIRTLKGSPVLVLHHVPSTEHKDKGSQ